MIKSLIWLALVIVYEAKYQLKIKTEYYQFSEEPTGIDPIIKYLVREFALIQILDNYNGNLFYYSPYCEDFMDQYEIMELDQKRTIQIRFERLFSSKPLPKNLDIEKPVSFTIKDVGDPNEFDLNLPDFKRDCWKEFKVRVQCTEMIIDVSVDCGACIIT